MLLLAGAAVLLLAALFAYAPAINGGFLWDDDRYVSNNPLMSAEDGLWRIWTTSETPQYYPLVFTSFWLEAHLWGLAPWTLHLVNIVLHVATAAMLWRVLGTLGIPGARLAVCIFALHPVHVESVAWISERKNVLSGLFYVSAFAAYLNYSDSGRSKSYIASLLLYAAALLSKTVTCTFPIAILLVQWWKHGRISKRQIQLMVPFFVLGASLGATTIWLEKYHVGAGGNEWDWSFLQRCMIAGRAVLFYAGKLALPTNLMFNYPRWHIDTSSVWQLGLPVLVIAIVLGLFRARSRIGRGPFAAVAFFIITLSPALGFVDVYPFRFSFVADHFQYLASIGMIVLATAAIAVGLRKCLSARISGISLTVVALVLASLCGALTYRHARLFSSAETLWKTTIQQNPRSWLAHYNLGVLLWLRGDIAGAEQQYLRTLEINPNHAIAYVNLGNIAAVRGDSDQAIKRYSAALAIDPAEPTAYYNLAKAYSRQGRTAEAIAAYNNAIAVDPKMSAARDNLGLLYLASGERDLARHQFELALRNDPRDATAAFNLGVVAERAGDLMVAQNRYVEALSIDPKFADAWYRSGVCWRKMDRLNEARSALRKAVEHSPRHALALTELAEVNMMRGDFDGAIENYTSVLKINPRDASARHNVSVIDQKLKRYAAAIAVLDAGLKADPDSLAIMHDLAKLLANCPDASLRDGPRAVELATHVVDRLPSPRPEALRTLAEAYAQIGRFDRAIAALERAIEVAGSAGSNALVTELRDQQDRYRSLSTS